MKHRHHPTYTLLDELAASPTLPLPAEHRRHILTQMWSGLASIERGEQPSPDDWRMLSDCVNMLETLISMGVCQDSSGLLQDAITGLAMAGRRNLAGHAIRLDASGIKAARAVLEDYAELLEQLPHRTIVRCHRITEKRIREILRGKKKPHDIELVSL